MELVRELSFEQYLDLPKGSLEGAYLIFALCHDCEPEEPMIQVYELEKAA